MRHHATYNSMHQKFESAVQHAPWAADTTHDDDEDDDKDDDKDDDHDDDPQGADAFVE